jgi:membrane-associated phospholipid phosphatase
METADEPVRDAVLRDRRYFKSVPIEAGRMWGEVYSPVLFFGGFAIHSLLTDDIGTRKVAYEIGQASLYTGIITYLLKVGIGRARPYVNEGATSFHPFSSLFNTDTHAYPGGHNAVALVLSTVLSRNARPLWLKALAYVPAALTFVSRIYQDQHWTSDDFAGAALGYLVATWVVDIHERQESPVTVSGTNRISISIAF